MATSKYQVKEIGKRFFVVYASGPSVDADNNGVFDNSEQIMSNPYTTRSGAERKMQSIRHQAGV